MFGSGAPCFLGPFGLPFGGQPLTTSLVASAPSTGATMGARGRVQRLLSERCDEGRLLNRGGSRVGARVTDAWTRVTAQPPSTHVFPGDGPPLAQLANSLCENPVLVGNGPVPSVLPASESP